MYNIIYTWYIQRNFAIACSNVYIFLSANTRNLLLFPTHHHRLRFQDKSLLDNCPLDNVPWTTVTYDNCLPENCPPDNFHLGKLLPRQLPPRTIALWTVPPDNSHLGLFYCPRIITSGQLLLEQQQLQITIFSQLFSVSFPCPNYIISVFC